MAAEGVISPAQAAGDAARGGPVLTEAQREFWLGLWAATVEWSRGLGACLAGAAVLQGVLSAFPVMLWWSVPVTVPVSAVAVALVGLRAAPPWGPVFAACVGLLADAAGPALPGATAWAYLPIPIAFALLHPHLRREHPVTLVLYAFVQTVMQTTGGYIGLRLAGLSDTAGHIAVAATFFSCVMAILAAACVALGLRLRDALGRQLKREP